MRNGVNCLKVLYTGFKGKNNSSYQLLFKRPGHKLFLTNSFKGLEKDIMNVTDQFDLVVMFGLDTSLKEFVRIESVAEVEDTKRITEVDCEGICRYLMASGVESVVSEVPTQYLCNAAYFNALQKFDGKVIFIHIPSLKNMSEDMMDRIVKCMEEMGNEYRV